jgi:hypothetical protein
MSDFAIFRQVLETISQKAKLGNNPNPSPNSSHNLNLNPNPNPSPKYARRSGWDISFPLFFHMRLHFCMHVCLERKKRKHVVRVRARFKKKRVGKLLESGQLFCLVLYCFCLGLGLGLGVVLSYPGLSGKMQDRIEEERGSPQP